MTKKQLAFVLLACTLGGLFGSALWNGISHLRNDHLMLHQVIAWVNGPGQGRQQLPPPPTTQPAEPEVAEPEEAE